MDGLEDREQELWYFELWQEESQESSTESEDMSEIYSSGLMDLAEPSFGQ